MYESRCINSRTISQVLLDPLAHKDHEVTMELKEELAQQDLLAVTGVLEPLEARVHGVTPDPPARQAQLDNLAELEQPALRDPLAHLVLAAPLDHQDARAPLDRVVLEDRLDRLAERDLPVQAVSRVVLEPLEVTAPPDPLVSLELQEHEEQPDEQDQLARPDPRENEDQLETKAQVDVLGLLDTPDRMVTMGRPDTLALPERDVLEPLGHGVLAGLAVLADLEVRLV